MHGGVPRIVRGTIRMSADGAYLGVPATIEDPTVIRPTVIPEIPEALAAPHDAPGKAVSDR